MYTFWDRRLEEEYEQETQPAKQGKNRNGVYQYQHPVYSKF